jgi:hypothetical protein
LDGTPSYTRRLKSSFQVLLLLFVNFALKEMLPAFLLAYFEQMCKFKHLENITMNALSSGVKIKPEQTGYAHIWGCLCRCASCE